MEGSLAFGGASSHMRNGSSVASVGRCAWKDMSVRARQALEKNSGWNYRLDVEFADFEHQKEDACTSQRESASMMRRMDGNNME